MKHIQRQGSTPIETLVSGRAEIITPDNKTLLLTRSTNRDNGMLEIPGGKIEEADILDGIYREVEEETGLGINILSDIVVIEDRIMDGKGKHAGMRYLGVCVLAITTEKDPVVTPQIEEVSDYAWVDIIDAMNDTRLTQNTRRCFEKMGEYILDYLPEISVYRYGDINRSFVHEPNSVSWGSN